MMRMLVRSSQSTRLMGCIEEAHAQRVFVGHLPRQHQPEGISKASSVARSSAQSYVALV